MFRLVGLIALLLGLVGPGAAFEVRQTAVSPGSVRTSELPPEARATLALIVKGGPFPHERDGIVFNNFEQRLPKAKRGYYREYTVRTPGVKHRGARRIVTGGNPPDVFYYTADHYQSFNRILE